MGVKDPHRCVDGGHVYLVTHRYRNAGDGLSEREHSVLDEFRLPGATPTRLPLLHSLPSSAQNVFRLRGTCTPLFALTSSTEKKSVLGGGSSCE